jgi:membrane peptidoglycan carboxypeptidase
MADPHWGPVEKVPERTAARRKPRSRGRTWTARIFATIGILAALGLVAGVAIVFVGYTTTQLPNPKADFQTATTTVYYRDGKTQLGTFAIQNRQPLAYEDMPKTMTDAIVAAENRTFWTDKGISIRGMARAAWVIARGGSLQGGSTITQQYIKILYLNSDQTFTRKFKELFLAYKINKQQSKEQILQGYLNTIYFGHGAYGVQAASKAFFNVDAKKLTVPQAAVLASVVNNPTYFDPSDKDNWPQLLDRYRYVLDSMAQMGDISPEQAAKYAVKLPKFPAVPVNERYGGPKGFLLKMVERELGAAGFDQSQISGGGLKIVTTFDKDAQDAAVKSAQAVTKQAADASGHKASKLHAAIASVDVGSGDVLALYGGPDYVTNSRNWATTPRPTASTFKAYALAAGLKDGFSLRSTFRGDTFTPPGEKTTIRNEYSFQYGYAVNLIKATADSINTAFVDLTTQMDDGPNKIIKVAEAAGAPKGAGWTSPGTNSRIALGAAEVSPLNQAEGYATFANDGSYVADHVVKQVQDPKGKVVYKANPAEKRAVSTDIAHDVTYALSNVVENGTGRSVQTLNRPVAGKTGTNGVTVKGKDIVNSAWFVGYTKQIATAVMYVAGDAGTSSLDVYRRPGDSTFFGGTYPALTWSEYMSAATDGQAVKDFDPPAYVNADKAAPTQTYEPSPTQSATQRSRPSNTPTGSPSAKPTGPTDEPSGGPTKKKRATTGARPSESQGGGAPGNGESAGGGG